MGLSHFFIWSNKEFADVVVAGEGGYFSAFAHQGEGSFEAVGDCLLNLSQSDGVYLTSQMLISLPNVVKRFGSFFKSFSSAEIGPIDLSFEGLLGKLKISLWDVSQPRKLLCSNIQYIFSLTYNSVTCDEDPETLMPKSPVSV